MRKPNYLVSMFYFECIFRLTAMSMMSFVCVKVLRLQNDHDAGKGNQACQRRDQNHGGDEIGALGTLLTYEVHLPLGRLGTLIIL
jgi:hypothetical protein